MKEKSILCLNCGQKAQSNFCANCGQETNVERITFKETWSHFLSSVFSLDGPLFKTVALLIANPRLLFSEYLFGKRKKYQNPVAFFVLTIAMYLFAKALFIETPHPHLSEESSINNPEIASLLEDSTIFVTAHLNNILFLLVLGFALAFKLFFPKSYFFTEYLTIGFYTSGTYILLNTLLSLLLQSLHTPNPYINFLLLFILIFYHGFALLKSKKFSAIFRLFFTCHLSILFYVLSGFGLSFLVIYLLHFF